MVHTHLIVYRHQKTMFTIECDSIDIKNNLRVAVAAADYPEIIEEGQSYVNPVVGWLVDSFAFYFIKQVTKNHALYNKSNRLQNSQICTRSKLTDDDRQQRRRDSILCSFLILLEKIFSSRR